MNDILKRKIKSLAKRTKCPLNWTRTPGDTFQWDGNDVACKKQKASNIIHDIAHFVIASREQRKIIDFGLGAGPDTGNQSEANKAELKHRHISVDQQEVEASALGILWEKGFGMDWKDTADYHNWDSASQLEEYWSDSRFKKIVRKYQKKKK